MTRRRSPLFWTVVLGAVVASLWWTLHIPRRPAAIFDAIPVQASFVTAHRNLAARWDEVFANSLVGGLFASANLKTEELREMREGPQFRDWLYRLASDDIVFALVPGLANGDDGWVFASWLGGRSQRLRVALQLSNIPGIRFVGVRRGWPVWEVKSRMFKGGETLSFSLVEGMLVGSYGASSHAIDTVLSCVDGRYPSLGRLAPEALPPADQLDRGWFRIPDPRAGLTQAPRIHFSFSELTSNRLAGTVRAPIPWLAHTPPLQDRVPASPARILNDLPQAVLVTPAGASCNGLLKAFPGLVTVVAADLIDGQTVGPLYTALVLGDYGGELFGMKWPTFVVAAASTNANHLEDRIRSRLDHLNSLKPWALGLDVCEAASQRISYVSSASNTLYTESRPEDRVAFTGGDGWVLAASNVGGLTNLLRDAVIRENRPARLRTVAEAAAKEGASAWFWCNLPEAGRSLRMGLGAWSLQVNSMRDAQARRTKNSLAIARRWIHCMEPLGQLQVWAKPVDAGTEFGFSTTPSPTP